MDFRNISYRIASFDIEAGRKKKKKKETKSKRTRKVTKERHIITPPAGTMLDPLAEYSCQVQVLFNANFSGDVSQHQLMEKLKDELVAAIKTAVTRTAADLGVVSKDIYVFPINLESAIHNQ